MDEEAALSRWVRIAAAWLVATTPLAIRAQPSLQCDPALRAAVSSCCAGKVCSCSPQAACRPRPASTPVPVVPNSEIPLQTSLQGPHLAAVLHPTHFLLPMGRGDSVRPTADSRIATRHSESMLALFCTLVV